MSKTIYAVCPESWTFLRLCVSERGGVLYKTFKSNLEFDKLDQFLLNFLLPLKRKLFEMWSKHENIFSMSLCFGKKNLCPVKIQWHLCLLLKNVQNKSPREACYASPRLFFDIKTKMQQMKEWFEAGIQTCDYPTLQLALHLSHLIRLDKINFYKLFLLMSVTIRLLGKACENAQWGKVSCLFILVQSRLITCV